MLEISNIQVLYSDVILAIKGISFAVPEGKIVTLLGNNGAGKTTILRAICGLLHSVNGELEKGTIAYGGESIERRRPEEVVQRGITMVPEGRGIFKQLTAEENLTVGAYGRRNKDGIEKDWESVWKYFPILKAKRNIKSGFFSGGEQQMLAIGRALMANPRLMILDEPSLGLSPLLVRELFSIIKVINQERGTTILLVEQNVNAALRIADYGYILEGGRIVLEGDSEKLLKNEDVQEFYLGVARGVRKNYSDVKAYKRRKRWLS
ncbi:MAG: ABC transporter ATP-binding protein [Peptococcaceae bacterium]|nr:MAG: ABC transporter ATP-binding protein [Peptococcaceae bacterium]